MLLEAAETNWLGSKPVFYNDKTNKISYSVSEVIDYNNLEFNPEGLRNYLKFGYCVLGQTPFQHVKFLRYSSKIEHDVNGKLVITEFDDPVEKFMGKTSSSEETLEKLKCSITNWEKQYDGDIVLPLSGGYDSKLLLSMIEDKKRIKAYSYGFSRRQEESFEVVRAKKLADFYGIDWKHVPLTEFLQYIPDWYDEFGISVHAHGMYQMEFYRQIAKEIQTNNACVLSGIIGDVWAGNARFDKIGSSCELDKLSYSHGMDIHEDICLLPDSRDVADAFWNNHREQLDDENWRVVYAMRMKLMLLRYLMEVPQGMGYSVWTPFLDIDTAMAMLTLPWEEKTDRKWQSRYFEEQKIEYGWLKTECDYNMILDETGLRHTKLEPLNEKLLSKIVRKDFVENVNKELSKAPWESFSAKPKTVPNILNKYIKKHNAPKVSALYSYEILYPLQKVMEKSF